MDESESKNEKPKEGRRFSQKQYDMLKRCSDNRDMLEWNKWRKKNKDEDIYLEGADFNKFYLVGVRLDEDPVNIFGKVYLERAKFRCANLNLARFFRAHLERSDFYHANLEGALMSFSHLEGTQFSRSNLRGAQLPFCIVNGSTIFLYCEINHHTWFYGVGLDNLRIDPETKQLLEYNIRRKNWEEWYPKHFFWRWPILLFWLISDYGLSATRVMGVFFLLAMFFAAIYANFACWYPPGIVSDLTVEPHLPLWHYFLLLLLRPIYFSVVTMTTLGFGDMYANAQSILGHLLLTVQVILGYVLLGALVTRFAVLFTAGGPAGKFAKEK